MKNKKKTVWVVLDPFLDSGHERYGAYVDTSRSAARARVKRYKNEDGEIGEWHPKRYKIVKVEI